jgi:hypothetical protein
MPQPRIKTKFVWIIFLFLAVGVCGLFVLVFPISEPPKESAVIQNFYTHRSAYERLRDMLLEDRELDRVAGWGVQTTNTVVTSKPPAGDFPLKRYNEYLVLLKETGGVGAFRDSPESVGVLVYASGWAGDTRHVSICWLEHAPGNVIASLDDFYRTPKPRSPVYKHIEGNWYIWADW